MIDRLGKFSWILIQRIHLVTVWNLVTGYIGNVIKGRQPSNLIGVDLTKSFWMDAAAKIKGIEPLVHILQLKKAPPDIWSSANAGDLWIKLRRKGGSWHHLKMLDQDVVLKLNMKLFLSFFPLFWHWPGKIMCLVIFPRLLLRVVAFWSAGFVIRDSDLSIVLRLPWYSLRPISFLSQCPHKLWLAILCPWKSLT